MDVSNLLDEMRCVDPSWGASWDADLQRDNEVLDGKDDEVLQVTYV